MNDAFLMKDKEYRTGNDEQTEEATDHNARDSAAGKAGVFDRFDFFVLNYNDICREVIGRKGELTVYKP